MKKGKEPKPKWPDVLNELRTKPTVSVPTAGLALGNFSKNAAYEAARQKKLGVSVIEVGGKLRVAARFARAARKGLAASN